MKKIQGKSARTLRLQGETVKQLSTLTVGQLRQAAGGSDVQSVCNFCMEDTVNCYSGYYC